MNVKAYQYINLEYLDSLSDGDDDIKKTMFEILFDELPEEIKKMQDLVKASDWKELFAVSHKMKSTLSFVGNDAMTEANRAIEAAAKNEENLSQIPAWMGVLTKLYENVLVELHQEYDRLA